MPFIFGFGQNILSGSSFAKYDVIASLFPTRQIKYFRSMKPPNVFLSWVVCGFLVVSCSTTLPPVDSARRPLIQKLGTIDLDLVETTPIVFKDRVYRFEWVRARYEGNKLGDHFRLVDRKSGRATEPFAVGFRFGSAFVEGDTVYVTGTSPGKSGWAGGENVMVFASRDLKSWKMWPALELPGWGIFNTSICKTESDYVLMFEISEPKEQAGVGFTARFARSKDLKNWTLTPPEAVYAKDRYTAPHALRYRDGWFYNFFLAAVNQPTRLYEMHVVRSRDLIHWELSPLNPVLTHSSDDKRIFNPRLSREQRDKIAAAENLNNSDLDFCEYKGRLLMNYSWGNQAGKEFLAEAEYAGTLEQFLQGWFPDGKK